MGCLCDQFSVIINSSILSAGRLIMAKSILDSPNTIKQNEYSFRLLSLDKLMHKTCWKNIFLNKFNSMDVEGTQRKRCYLLA